MGAGNKDKNFGFYDATVDGGWQVPDEHLYNAKGTDFYWWRARMLGGRTNHWGRYSLRYSEHDFKGTKPTMATAQIGLSLMMISHHGTTSRKN
ncbi:hypothetical protein P4S63_20670 [Pseudoalteromonas sp. B193]